MTDEIEERESLNQITSFLLVRHGQKIHGVGDLGLTECGVEQATQLALMMNRCWVPDRIYTSTFRRTKETARIIADQFGIEPVEHSDLVERKVFPPPGGGTPEFKIEWSKVDADRDYASFGGESSRTAGQRLDQALRVFGDANGSQRVLVVTHGGIIRDFLVNLVEQQRSAGIDLIPRDLSASDVPNGSATKIELRNGRFEIEFFGIVGSDLCHSESK